MRFVLVTLLALALGFLPVAAARAGLPPVAQPVAASCHEQAEHAPATEDGKSCAHCMSQVNGHARFARLPGPSWIASIDAAYAPFRDAGKPRLRDPPEPPPPRA